MVINNDVLQLPQCEVNLYASSKGDRYLQIGSYIGKKELENYSLKEKEKCWKRRYQRTPCDEWPVPNLSLHDLPKETRVELQKQKR